MNEQTVVPVVSENVETSKRTVETGTVRVRKTVHERQRTVEQALHSENVEVSRIPKNERVDGPQQVRLEGDTTIIPVVKEVLRIEKDWILVEEIHLTRRREQRTESIPVTLLEEEVSIERVSSADKPENLS